VRFIKSIVFILCFVPAWAEEDNGDAGEFLRGLEGVRVIVKASYVVKEKGITEEQLKTAVEGRLQRAGLQLSKDRMLPKDDPEAFWMATEPADLSPLILLVYGSRMTLRLAQTYFPYEDLDDIFSEVLRSIQIPFLPLVNFINHSMDDIPLIPSSKGITFGRSISAFLVEFQSVT